MELVDTAKKRKKTKFIEANSNLNFKSIFLKKTTKIHHSMWL